MNKILKKLKIEKENYGSCIGANEYFKTSDAGYIESFNPTNGDILAKVYFCSENDYEKI